MRRVFPDKVERGRDRSGTYASPTGADYGRGVVFYSATKAALLVLWSPGCDEIPFEHVSVTVPGHRRCPTWEEMSWVKSLFWEDDEAVMQLHPPKSEHVNYHPYCLHLWKPTAASIPLPASIAVGPKGEPLKVLP